MDDVITGDGWAVSSLDKLGDGPGFRKIRTPLGVTAFGMNAIVLPPGIETGRHCADGYVGRDGHVPSEDEQSYQATQ